MEKVNELTPEGMKYLADYFEKNGLHAAEAPADPIRDIREWVERHKDLCVGLGSRVLADVSKGAYTPVIIVGAGFMAHKEKLLMALDKLGKKSNDPVYIWGSTGEEIPPEIIEGVEQFCITTKFSFEEAMVNLNSLIASKMPTRDELVIELKNVIMNLPEAVDHSDRYYTPPKVQHFQDKNLGAKVGGRKQKKNPFRYRR